MIRHDLTETQCTQVATIQKAMDQQKQLLATYLQGVIDGIPDVPSGTTWQLVDGALVTNDPVAAPPSV